ncbi:hypothetical protein Tco_1144930 [Tanacetum coccineum]
MIACSIFGRGQAPEKVTGIDLFYPRIIDQGTANVLYLLAQYLFRHAEGRKSRARLSGGHFIRRPATYFSLVNDEGLRGLSAWVAPRLERQPIATAGAPTATKDAHVVDEGAPADLAPMQAPQPSHAAPRTISQRIARLDEEVHELRRSIMRLRGDVDRSITDQNRFATWMVSWMTQLMDASGRTYQAFNITVIGSSRLPIRDAQGAGPTMPAPP